MAAKQQITLPASEVVPFFDQKWRLAGSSAAGGARLKNPEGLLLIKLLRQLPRGLQLYALDLGCGDGKLAVPMAKAGFATIAMDSSKEAIRRLSLRAKHSGVKPNVCGLVADIRGVKLPKESFAVVSAARALHYLTDTELARTLKRMQRATLVGGLNYIAFESEMEMQLGSELSFGFAGQKRRSAKSVAQLLKAAYGGSWKVLRLSLSKNKDRCALPARAKKLLKSKEKHYTATRVTVECIAQRVKK